MEKNLSVPDRIRGAWQGRVSGCLLGKPVEVLSFSEGRHGLESYLREAGALPLRDYVPLIEGTLVERLGGQCCRGHICRAEPDDDINYTVLDLRTEDVARAWLRLLPAGTTWTAERWAYRMLLDHMADEFVNGEAPGFDLALCSESDYNEWIGAQIRADLYGWVCPGRPALAADLTSGSAPRFVPISTAGYVRAAPRWRPISRAATRHCLIGARAYTEPHSSPPSRRRYRRASICQTRSILRSASFLRTVPLHLPCASAANSLDPGTPSTVSTQNTKDSRRCTR
jgi:hypothetical protein